MFNKQTFGDNIKKIIKKDLSITTLNFVYMLSQRFQEVLGGLL